MAVFTFCGDTEEKARELRKAVDIPLIRSNRGGFRIFTSTEEVFSHRFSVEDQAFFAFNYNYVVSGTPEQVRPQFTQLAAEYGVDEITAVTITADFEDRVRSYELLVEAFELAPEAAKREKMLA